MLEEIEHGQVSTFVPQTDLRTFFILVASNNVSFKEVVPRVTSFECSCIEEFYFLLFNSEKEILSGFDQNHINVVI